MSDIVETDIRKIDLNLLVALKVLLEERNVSRAAGRLALTQPTVSGMLARLRVLFDEPLFVRSQHGMVPTPHAEALAPALERLLRDAQDLVEPRAFDPATTQMDFRISANDYMQTTVLLPFIQALRSESPQSRLALRNQEVVDLERMLARGEIDLAVTIPEFIDPSLESQLLYREEYVCAVRQSHPIRSSRVSMDRFLKYDHVLVSPSEGHFRGPVDDVLAKQKRQRRVALSVPSFLLLLQILQTDDLIALVPKRLLTGHPHSLRIIRPPIDVPGFDVIAAWHGRSNQDPAHQWIRERLAEVSATLS
jgi:DNA-binding transcriptional LysR family regulator